MFLLAIDQGTSSTKTLLFNELGNAVAKGSAPLRTSFLDGGRVEQDPAAIFNSVLQSVRLCLHDFLEKGGDRSQIQACGISNQRETFILWDEHGQPFHPAIVWQCKRSIPICERLKREGLEPLVKAKTGLLLDPYFSGTKLIHLCENDPAIRQAVQDGRAHFGTVDAWLLFKLTGGKRFATDLTNASRTLFFNLQNLDWDRELLHLFGLEGLRLPELLPSAAHFGESHFDGLLPKPIPISGMIGDSHAAAFGEGCFEAGTAKATLGTGCSLLMNVGAKPHPSAHGMVTTLCWSLPGRTDFALEGAIVSCGATVEWLKNGLGILDAPRQTEQMAQAAGDNGGVYLVPAFSGLGAPHWDMNRKASIHGLTFGSTKNHLVRAALESIAYQIKDVVAAMELDAGAPTGELRVNGGMASNGFVVQMLADLLGIPVCVSGIADASALGAAYVAGLEAGVFLELEQLAGLRRDEIRCLPGAGRERAAVGYAGWKRLMEGE